MTDPTILELHVRIDQHVRDVDEDCAAIRKWVEDQRSSDHDELVDELDGLRNSIVSELCLLRAYVGRLETEDTRGRIVPEVEA